jgi:hypothetical protein
MILDMQKVSRSLPPCPLNDGGHFERPSNAVGCLGGYRDG